MSWRFRRCSLLISMRSKFRAPWQRQFILNLGIPSRVRMSPRLQRPLNPSLKHNPHVKKRRAPPGNRGRPQVGMASEVADGAGVVGEGAVVADASKLWRRRSLRPPRMVLFPTCQELKKSRQNKERWERLNPRLRPRRERPAFQPPFPRHQRVRRRVSLF